MKLHNRFSYLWPRYDDEHIHATLRADALAVARFEPVYSQRFDAYFDVLFERDGKWLVVPMFRAEGASVMAPEHPPVTWPVAYERFDRKQIDAIEDRLIPWLRSIAIGRLVHDEEIRFFRDEERLRSEFEGARAASWLGAAKYAEVVRATAPAAYALRFARNRQVALRGAGAATGAAILSNVAAGVDFESGDTATDAAARKWFGGLSLGAVDTAKAYDLYVGPRDGAVGASCAVYADPPAGDERAVELAEPIAMDVLLSFDTEDAPPAYAFGVAQCAVPVRRSRLSEPVVGGGSGGRIRLVVRDEAMRFRDADVDAAETLAARLRAEGFDAMVSVASRVDVAKTDVIHVFDLRHGVGLVELLRDAEMAGVPVVTTPYADDRRNEALSGCSSAILIPRNTNDVVTLEEYASAMALRRLSGLTQGDWYDDASRVLLARSSAVIVSSVAETQYLREFFGYQGPAIPVAATVSHLSGTENIGSLVGPDEFILIHSSLEARMNQVFAALAAQREGLPLVLLGPVADVEFYRFLNEIVGPGTVQLRDDGLTDAEIAGIYGRARVVADVSWSSRGLHRLARGASMGAALVAPPNGYAHDIWGDLVRLVDPGNIDEIARGFREAWERQPRLADALIARTLDACDPFAGLVAVVSAYQQASAVPA